MWVPLWSCLLTPTKGVLGQEAMSPLHPRTGGTVVRVCLAQNRAWLQPFPPVKHPCPSVQRQQGPGLGERRR